MGTRPNSHIGPGPRATHYGPSGTRAPEERQNVAWDFNPRGLAGTLGPGLKPRATHYGPSGTRAPEGRQNVAWDLNPRGPAEPLHFHPRRLVVLLTLFLCLALPVDAAPDPGIGSRISAVELRLDAPLGRRLDIEPLLAVRPGRELSERAIRRTLSSLQATGLFSEIEIFSRLDPAPADESGAEPTVTGDIASGDTVTVVVVLRARTWVRSVELRGDLRLPKRSLLRAVAQREASALVAEQVEHSVVALENLYRERGYREATVQAQVRPSRHDKLVDLVFELGAGRRALVGRVTFDGDTGPFEPDALRDAMGIYTNRRYDRAKVETGLQRLRSWLGKRGYLSAHIELPRESYDPDSRRMALDYPFELGPMTEVEVVGASLRNLKKRGFLPFLEGETFDELALDQRCKEIAEHFQRKGRYEVEVRCQVEDLGDAKPLSIEVDPGEEFELTDIAFNGNEEVADEDLLELMSTSPKKRFSPGSGRLVEADLEEDLDNLRSYYLLHGFGDVEIGAITVTQDGRQLKLEIEVREGQRQRLVDFTFSGIELLDIDRVRSDLPLSPGGPYHPALLDESLDLIRALYEDQGFPSVNLTPRLDWNDEHTLVDLHVEVEEGPQATVDRIILRGQRHSKTRVLQQLIDLEEGEPISRRRLLEVERDLYQLGIFSKVDIEQRTVSESSEKRDVVIRLEEGRRYRLAYGLSYDTEDGAGGLLSVTRVNIGGRGDRLQYEFRGNELDSRFRLLYDQPRLGRFNLPITYSLFGQTEDRVSFAVDNLGAQVAITKDLPTVRLRGVVEYRSVEITALTPDFFDFDPNDIEREDREVEIFSLIPILYIDRRDDPLDPQDGWTTALQLEYALPFAAAETHFLKLFWQHTHYRSLGRLGGLAASWRFGAIEPLSTQVELDPLVPSKLRSALVPVSERFFAGGRTSHRAYERDKLGIVGETLFPGTDELVEVGGNGIAVLNLDYRFPITGPVGGVVFLDYGNVWADWRDFDLGDFRPGIGLGVRYTSPIGPVRLEVGWKLDPEPGDESGAAFFLSFGNPF
ncbi:MAG: POTRA domain-containing protein [Acidobacteriota bacterium]